MKTRFFFLLPALLLSGCTSSGVSSSKEESKKSGSVETTMKLSIDGKELKVAWESNDSVKAIKEALPITINMNEFGGFEQTGPLGFSVTRSDTQMDVVPGDIVLYGGNAISVFYNESAWTYTRLGHIDLSQEELIALLKKPSVTFTLKGE